MAPTREKLRPRSAVWVRGTVDRATTVADQGVDSVLVWVDNVNDDRPGHRQHHIAVRPADVRSDEDVAYLPDFAGEGLDQLTSTDDPATAEGLLRRLLGTFTGEGSTLTSFTYQGMVLFVGYGDQGDTLELTDEEEALLERLLGAETSNPDA